MPCSAGAFSSTRLILLGEGSSNGNAAAITGEDSSRSSDTLASAGPFATLFPCKQETRQKHNTDLWLSSIVLFEARQSVRETEYCAEGIAVSQAPPADACTVVVNSFTYRYSSPDRELVK